MNAEENPMSNSKVQKSSTPDSLTKSGKEASIELSETALDKVAGGNAVSDINAINQNVTVNKAKTADKAFKAMDGYIRG
jgi:hypothetical protein